MRKILLILAFLITGFGADAAAPRTNARAGRGGTSAPGATTTSTTSMSARGRAATQTPTAPSTSTRTTITSSQSTQRTSGNAVSTGVSSTGSVASRAAKQSVISTGTKVAAAAQNTVVDEKCWNGFVGCMDSFCMLDNANGGRCTCSDKNAEYDSILAEIQSLDEQSYQMATVGVERIEMGNDADAVIKKTQEITKSIEQDSTQTKRKSLDLSAWNFNEIDFDADTEDIFSLASDGTSIVNKTGDALYRAAAKLCNTQLPECKSQSTMMELMYKQRIRSDCTAYENSLRQQRTQSAQKLATAQSAMREAALEQYRNANKYDLGQCTVQFKQCMQTTGGCGDDFSGCVALFQEYSAAKNIDKIKQKKINGAFSNITIAQSTYDILESKKELCMNVTQQCVNVRDQVWDTFLREIVPQVKSAELMAESNLRTSCISNIANCFQKACKDTMDPNDPDGSYDMCLTRPETLESVCKVELEPCKKIDENIMTYVKARLASMRVDSCTKEFKQCLTSEDRCGTDYAQCIGLDTDTIVRMCPRDKLVGCYNSKKPDQDVYDELAEIATGVFLNIDNNLLSACQKAVQSKVLEICGSLSECDAFADDDTIGTDSLVSYKDAYGDTTIDGLMNFGLLTFDDNNSQKPRFHLTAMNNYINGVSDAATKNRITSAYKNVENRALQKFNVLSTDLTIKRCVEGRDDKWRYNASGDETNDFQRFPHLLNSYTQMIFNSALEKAIKNYRTKYDELVADALRAQSDDEKQIACTMMAHNENSVNCSVTEEGETICKPDDNPIGNLFNELYSEQSGGLTNGGASYVIKRADLSKKLELMSHNSSQLIILGDDGKTIGSVRMTALYSPGTQTCTITTITSQCLSEEDYQHMEGKRMKYYEDGTVKKCKGKCHTVSEGVKCPQYSDPDKKVTEIKM